MLFFTFHRSWTLKIMVFTTISIIVVLAIFLPQIYSQDIHVLTQLQKDPKTALGVREGGILKKSSLKFYKKPSRNLKANAGDQVMLECHAGGNPPPTIQWLKDGQILKQDSKLDGEDYQRDNNYNSDVGNKLAIGSTASRLYLPCLKPGDSSKYVCRADNGHQRISSSTLLTVDNSNPENTTCISNKADTAPKIILWTKQRFEYLGVEVGLKCRAIGVPEPSIVWLGVNGEALQDDIDKYQVFPNGDLLIQDLKWSDMGIYTCVAANVHGVDKAETFLYPTKPEE